MANVTYGVSTKMLKDEKFYHMNEKIVSRLDTDLDNTNKISHKGNGDLSWGVTDKIIYHISSIGEERLE